jgi:rhamnulokinase
MSSGVFVAADLGASSGRVMLGRVGPDRLELEEVHRFRNGPVALPDGLHWDVLGLYTDILIALRSVARTEPDLAGIGVDTWAVDYGLLDPGGRLLGNPFHYRDARTSAEVVAGVHERVGPSQLYAITGLAHLPFNTLFQFAADRAGPAGASTALLIPDLLGYWLTGQRYAEETNASTTGLLDARSGQWAAGVIDRLGLPAGLLPPIVPAGLQIGPASPRVLADTGLNPAAVLSTVASHDTASAVVGVPADTDEFAFISCGTWGLVGVELEQPVLTEESRAANFTNERGVDATIRYLRNVMGLWLLQESLRTWRTAGIETDLTVLLAAAADLPPGGPVIDPNDPIFLPPGDLPALIAAACRRSDQPAPGTPAAVVRCILDSLAAAFATSVADAARLSGKSVSVIHLVGGGAANTLLCRLTADASGLPVIAGPVEATALGNVLIQARTLGYLRGDLASIRRLLRETHPTRTYQPGART